MLGSQLVVQALKRQGVRVIFSLSGNQIMPIYDACLDHGIRVIHVRHEAAAVFMADAWSQVTGEVGVAMLTAGPGITNGIAPLYSAAQAESAVLLLSGDSSVAEDGLGAFQEMDQVAITRPLTKLSQRPTNAAELSVCVDHAIRAALSGRRGPVHLALPFDLLSNDAGSVGLPPLQPQAAQVVPADAELDRVRRLLQEAKKPVVLGGPSSARAWSRQRWVGLSDALAVPVVSMESPRGLKDPSAGALADVLPKSDLVILAGKRLDFTLSFARANAISPEAKLIVLDPDADEVERAVRILGQRVAFACNCDPAAFLARVAPTSAPADRSMWRAAVDRALACRDLAVPPAVGPGAISSPALCDQVQAFLRTVPEPILVCDGGEFGQWAQAGCSAPVRVINGMSGAIGGGICYAIAAKLARPQATVVALMGDGTSGFHFMEFDTAVREKVGFTAVIGNDFKWNAEHLIQLRSYGADRTFGCELAPSARYHDVARALGGHGVEVSSCDGIGSALRAAAGTDLPTCVNIPIESQAAPVFSAASTGHTAAH